MASIKFYSDSEKTNQVYPEINPDGNYPGVTVGLANNLVSPDGITDTDTWIYRSTGGELDVSDGYADLKKLIGSTTSSTIEESLTYNLIATGVTAISINSTTFKSQISTSGTYNFIYTPTITYSSGLVYSLNKSTFANYVNKTTGTYTFTYTAVVSPVDTSSVITTFNKDTFVTKVNESPNTYTFTFDGTNWKLNSNNVTMSQYGITTNGNETSGTVITVYYTSNSWYYNNAAISMSNYGITTTGTESVGDTIAITYTSNDWQLNNSVVTLSSYGISITTGTPAIDDNIQVIFVAEQVGVIVTANPTSLYSVGMNQFDKNGNKIFNNYTINSSGAISAASGYYVVYFKVLGGEVYTVYNTTASSTVRVGYSASIPTTSTTVSLLSTVSSSEWADTLVNNTYMGHYLVPDTEDYGYLVVATSDINNLCCHLTWEGINDEVYESYFDATFEIPYRDAGGNVITTYGLVNLDNTTEYYDEIDFGENKFYKRTTRIVYSAENLATVQAMDVPYLYDDSWIYYGIETVEYDLSDLSSAYRISDYGTEEFLGTSLPLTATIFYQDNLRNKLMFSCEVIDNKVTTITSSSTDTEYPSAAAVWKLDQALRKILGLNVDTFSTTKTYAVGDYVVYQLKLWKCTTAVTSAGAWTGDTVITKSSDSSGIVASFNEDKFEAWLKNVGICSSPELYALSGGSYSIHLTYATSSQDIDFSDAAELLSATGITVNAGVTGTAVFLVSNGNWTESYLFKAN